MTVKVIMKKQCFRMRVRRVKGGSGRATGQAC